MIKVLKKAAAILEMTSQSRSISFAELQKGSGLNKSTLSHILATLQELDYIQRTKDGEVRIGDKFSGIFAGGTSKNLVVEIAEKCANELMSDISELTVISMRHEEHRLTLCKLIPQRNFQISTGDNVPYQASWYKTASGRLLLAFAGEEEITRIISGTGLPTLQLWPEAADRQSLSEELEKIKKDKIVSFTVGPILDTIAVPAADASGQSSFAVSCAIPLISYEKIPKSEIIRRMRRTASHLSKELTLNNITAAELTI